MSNVIEDEKEARAELSWMKIGLGMFVFGIIYWWMRKPRKQ
jgi:hypothetical protein